MQFHASKHAKQIEAVQTIQFLAPCRKMVPMAQDDIVAYVTRWKFGKSIQ
jgi:hypothetical protein